MPKTFNNFAIFDHLPLLPFVHCLLVVVTFLLNIFLYSLSFTLIIRLHCTTSVVVVNVFLSSHLITHLDSAENESNSREFATRFMRLGSFVPRAESV